MSVTDGPPTTSLAPKPRRQLFSKRPAWSSTADTSASEDPTEDVFTRSAQSYQEIIADKKRKQQRKAEKEQVKTEKSQIKAEEKARRDSARRESGEGSATKRRRITDEDYERFGLQRSPEKKDTKSEHSSLIEDDETVQAPKQRLISRPQAVRTKSRDSAKTEAKAPVIALDDSSDYEVTSKRSILPRNDTSQKITPPEPDLDSEEEFPELVAAARKRRKEREAEANQQEKTSTPTSTTLDTSFSSTQPDLAAPNPIIQILISSPIPDTAPLLVHRRLSQRLQEVREVWCQKQNFSDVQSAQVFLTFKLRRLYDVTTCKSLGLKVDSQGKIIREDKRSVFDLEEDEQAANKVHILAVTEEVWGQLKAEKAKVKEGSRGRTTSASFEDDPGHDVAGGAVQDEAENEPEKERLIRIVLKAKGFKDFKLKVKPTTTFARMIASFKREYKVAESSDVSLFFDGEKMNPDGEIQDSEIEDMDSVEVHVK